MAAPNPHPEDSFDDILNDWIPLTVALNAINRSMGKDDLYPFVLSQIARRKLTFVHDRVRSFVRTGAGRQPAQA
jgi:hypothetical protein